MAKKIIVLEKIDNDLSFHYAFWLTVPITRKPYYVNASASSQYKDASAAEITAIQDGSIVEMVGTGNYTSGSSVASIQTDLVNKFNDKQNYITNFNPYLQYGRFWDGTGWTAGGVS